jgi:hypothetical protein
VCSLRLPASWPHELVAAIVGVIVIEEVVADTNEMSSKKSALAQLPSSSSELVLEVVSVVTSTSVIAYA